MPAASLARTAPTLPPGVGVSLKTEHYAAIRAASAWPDFFEVHAENYLGAGGPGLRMLEWLRGRSALSVHGVGLSLGGMAALDSAHLERVATLVEHFAPAAFSEHLAWSNHGGRYFNDLLPLPYTAETLNTVVSHIDQVQERLRRTLLLENPASYVQFATSSWHEADFLAEVQRRSGCGLLLDLGNIRVSCINHRLDPLDYLARLPLTAVGEIHLAGHASDQDDDGSLLLIDSHDRAVSAETWALYEHVLARLGPCPTLIEWDSQLPTYAALCAEAALAAERLALAAPGLAVS